jgi:hypothetical protein
LWRVFGLTEILQLFDMEMEFLMNLMNLMNESASHFSGRWILITTVFHIPKSTSTSSIPDFFREYVCDFWAQMVFWNLSVNFQSKFDNSLTFILEEGRRFFNLLNFFKSIDQKDNYFHQKKNNENLFRPSTIRIRGPFCVGCI